jgi:hypothetical protein
MLASHPAWTASEKQWMQEPLCIKLQVLLAKSATYVPMNELLMLNIVHTMLLLPCRLFRKQWIQGLLSIELRGQAELAAS